MPSRETTDYLISFMSALNVLFDELKITDEKERKRLREIVAKDMGKTQGEFVIARVREEMKKQNEENNDK